MAKRKQYHVTADKKKGGWKVTLTGASLQYNFKTKPPAVQKAVELARKSKPSQVLIHKLDGKIQEERTYGDDPRRSKG